MILTSDPRAQQVNITFWKRSDFSYDWHTVDRTSNALVPPPFFMFRLTVLLIGTNITMLVASYLFSAFAMIFENVVWTFFKVHEPHVLTISIVWSIIQIPALLWCLFGYILQQKYKHDVDFCDVDEQCYEMTQFFIGINMILTMVVTVPLAIFWTLIAINNLLTLLFGKR